MNILESFNQLFTKEEYKNFDRHGTMLKLVIILTLSSVLAFFLSMGVSYYRDDIKTIPANERSFPAPRTY